MNIYIYIAVIAIVSYLIRVLPLTLIRKPITNVTLNSFLYYVPYVTRRHDIPGDFARYRYTHCRRLCAFSGYHRRMARQKLISSSCFLLHRCVGN